MKLIIVDRRKAETFRRLKDKFIDDINVEVLFERRVRQRRLRNGPGYPERRARDRRRLLKTWNGRDYIVIQLASR
jgi:hypothetical protein